MNVFDEAKIDCHAHVLDPARFPFGGDIAYHPAGQEIGTADQMVETAACFGVTNILLVQPNSGYGPDNAAMLDAIRRRPDFFRGVAIADASTSLDDLLALKAQGIVGIALNPTFHGNEHYAGHAPLFERLAEAGMFAQLQVEHDQLRQYLPWIEAIPVEVLIDHCGRPTPAGGLGQPGFADLLRLAETGRVHVKLSGYAKFSADPYPFEDTWPFVAALLSTFGPDYCMWASDWPFLRSVARQDYGPLVRLVGRLIPDAEDRARVFRATPARLFGFA